MLISGILHIQLMLNLNIHSTLTVQLIDKRAGDTSIEMNRFVITYFPYPDRTPNPSSHTKLNPYTMCQTSGTRTSQSYVCRMRSQHKMWRICPLSEPKWQHNRLGLKISPFNWRERATLSSKQEVSIIQFCYRCHETGHITEYLQK